jgi:signal transduction histidine kinase
MRVVAHDLRNPIGSMISASYLVFMDSEPTPDQAEVIEIIRRSGDKAIALIGDLLVSYSEEKMLVKTPLEIDDLVTSCIDMLRHKAEEKQQSIDFTPSEVVVNADKKVWRVFSNLIGNSIKFSPVGGKIEIRVKKVPGKVVLSVKDNGIGIPDEMKDEIFELSPAKGRDGTSGEKSFGLGLYSCKQIIDAHQGTMSFESIAGEGTTFYVELPSIGFLPDGDYC